MKPQLKKKLQWAIAISLATPLLICLFYLAGAFERLEFVVEDALARKLRGHKQASPDVAVILIDEASLKAMNPLVGRWPWPRSVFADVIEFISMGSPKAIVFDILFTENETGARGGLGPGDRSLVAATRESGVVYHAQQIVVDSEDEYNKGLLGRPMPAPFLQRFALKEPKPPGESPSNNYYLPFKELYSASKGLGVVEFSPDSDGVYRRTKPLRQYKGDFFPVLGLAPLIDVLKPEKIEFRNDSFILGDIAVPLDGDGRFAINMYGKYSDYSISGILASVQKLRAGELEDMMVSPDEFEGKIVLIGASAVGVEDVKTTSVSSMMPGVMLHASFIDNILHRDFMRRAGKGVTVFLVFLMSAIAVAGILFSARLYIRLSVPLAIGAVYALFVMKAYGANRLFETVPQMSALLLGFMASFAYLTFTEGKEKRKVRKMLGQYVSPQVLSEVVDRYEDFLKAEVGGREHITILFSDIRGFTSFSESLPPDKVVEMLNHYFSVWSDVIFKYGGTVDKFIGDAVMAFWGAPIKTEDHAVKAVTAAAEMVQKLPEINAELVRRGFASIRIGIGINTGYAILGNIGSEKKLDYTVIGDTVNLASRVESLTKNYACDILITEYTYSELGGAVPCRLVDTVKVKGKEIPVKIYEVSGGN